MGHTAEFVDGIEVGVGLGPVEQHVAADATRP
jgi:hypothetical protein